MRAGAYKCNICGRKFTTRIALLSHKVRIHNTTRQSPLLEERKTPERVIRKGLKPSYEKPKAEIAPTVAKNAIEGTVMGFDRDVHFACPKCNRLFLKNFTAIKHIQKNHCVNANGKPVRPDSKELIKPIQREKCVKCAVIINSEDFHLCLMSEEELGLKSSPFGCLGCRHCFPTMRSFDLHIPGVHKEGFQCMFFPTKNGAIEWIKEVEMITKSKYACMFSQGANQVYRCTYIPSENNTMLSCPSSFQIHEFPTGYQVRFYTNHYGHKSQNYVLREADKANLITSYFLKAESYHDIVDSISDPKDHYVQFKNVMEKIILEAAKVNAISLNELMGKALDMSQTLNTYIDLDGPNYEQDDKSISFKKNHLTDDQINKVLEDNEGILSRKRKSSISQHSNTNLEIVLSPPDTKCRKMDTKLLQPQIVDTFSLNKKVNKNLSRKTSENITNLHINGEETKNMAENKKNNNVLPTPQANHFTLLSELPSFNDSYKHFIGETLKPIPEKTARKKEIVKTKIGQFNPKSPKKKNTTNTHDHKKSNKHEHKQLSNKHERKITNKTACNPKPVIAPPRRSSPLILKRKSKDVKYQAKKRPVSKQPNPDVSLILKRKPKDVTYEAKKSPVSKQPNPDEVSPKLVENRLITISPPPSTPPVLKRKPKDIVYEVMEQENDCNILVLKI